MPRKPNSVCSVCDTSVYRRPFELAKFEAIYCSKTCQGQGQRSDKKCPICSEWVPPQYIHCSRACANKARAGMKYDGPRKDKVFKNHLNRKRLIERDGEFCQWCGVGPEWHGKPLTLQVDHIDGERNNNDPTNLRLLCPNCHSQTDTWAIRNVLRKRALESYTDLKSVRGLEACAGSNPVVSARKYDRS